MGEHATGTANFERVLVSSNTAGGDSGGIHLYRISGSVLDSTFTANTADDSGGAFGQDSQDGAEKELSIETSTFTSNVAIAGGAVAFKQDTATITGCTFEENTANDEPGVQPGEPEVDMLGIEQIPLGPEDRDERQRQDVALDTGIGILDMMLQIS